MDYQKLLEYLKNFCECVESYLTKYDYAIRTISNGYNPTELGSLSNLIYDAHLTVLAFVEQYKGNHKVKHFSCAEHFRVMAFAQLTHRKSLRDVEVAFNAIGKKAYHMGIKSRVAKSTLADANGQRDWRIYADFAQVLIDQAKKLYAEEPLDVEWQGNIYAIDATTIDLCLAMFPWAKFRRTKAAVKLHTKINLRGNIPDFIHISDGKLNDVNALDLIIPEANAFYLIDRAYTDFQRLYLFHQAEANFVSLLKKSILYKRRYSHKADKDSGIRSDQTIILTGKDTSRYYPKPLRRIRFYSEERKRYLVFITNNFDLPAETVAKLYKMRWQFELFFKWIKQNLRIKTFFGYNENAVKVQVWIAVCTYLIVAILKKEQRLLQPMSEILQVLSILQFEKRPISELFTAFSCNSEHSDTHNQLPLFDL